MTPIFSSVHSLELRQARTFDKKTLIADSFHLGVRLCAGGELVRYRFTYIPKKLQVALDRDDCAAICITPLPVEFALTKLLPTQPNYLLMGVVTKGAGVITSVPRVLEQARKIGLMVGVAACVLGVLGLVSDVVWVGAALLVVGTHCVRYALTLPNVTPAELSWVAKNNM